MTKTFRLLLALCCAALLSMSSLALAAAPKTYTQVPGYTRLQVGQFEVTALFDGVIDIDTKLLKNTKPAELDALLARMFVGNPKMQTAVIAFLVNTGKELVLVDTGMGGHRGPALGHIAQNLRAAGYSPEQVDAIVLTHMHGDHMGGMTDAAGTPMFPKAKVLVAEQESAFWLSQHSADAAPKDKQMYFAFARKMAAPYLAAGRWSTFAEGSVLVPGITAVNTWGHTPGHTAVAVESEGQKLLIVGDLVHAHAVQFARPGVSIEYDVDQTKAIAARRAVFKDAAAGKYLLGGMHLPFPGLGHVRAEGEDAFAWVPLEFAPLKPAK
jgi:glyoxylase-like metal-dependent hydrolase (beta-lactamase superfamily II)